MGKGGIVFYFLEADATDEDDEASSEADAPNEDDEASAEAETPENEDKEA